MIVAGGHQVARVAEIAEIPPKDRVNVDGWPSRAGMYCQGPENNLCMRLIDYPVDSTEPRHVTQEHMARRCSRGAPSCTASLSARST